MTRREGRWSSARGVEGTARDGTPRARDCLLPSAQPPPRDNRPFPVPGTASHPLSQANPSHEALTVAEEGGGTHVNLALGPGSPGAGNRAADTGGEDKEGDEDDGLLVDDLPKQRRERGKQSVAELEWLSEIWFGPPGVSPTTASLKARRQEIPGRRPRLRPLAGQQRREI